MTPSANSTEKAAGASSQTNQGEAQTNQSTVAANNSQLNGAVQNTGYYQNQVKSGTAATTQGYDASARNLKQSMEAAGVQGNSGMAAGAQTALGAKEDSALSQVKTNAYADTEAQQLKANSQDLEASGQQSAAGQTYANMENTDAIQRQQQGWKNQSALTSAVLDAAIA